MTLTVAEIAALVEGRLESGDGSAIISGVASLAEAQGNDLSFFGNAKYLAALKTSQAGAIFIRPGLDFSPQGAAIVVENPSMAFAIAMEKLRPEPVPLHQGIHPTAVIGIDCRIDPSASIQPYAVIQDGVAIGAGSVVGAHSFIGHGTTLGANCLIYPHVTVRERAQIGNRVILHPNVVIGSDGFGYETVQGRHVKIPQIGIVQLDDDVEIGAGSAIDRARFGRTWIGEGTKVDNLVHIAHNVVIGKHCFVIAQTGIAGSAHIGNYVILAGQCGVGGHVTIGDKAIVGGKSGASRNIPPGEQWMGMLAEPMKSYAAKSSCINRLPTLFKRVRSLENLVGKIAEISESDAPES